MYGVYIVAADEGLLVSLRWKGCWIVYVPAPYGFDIFVQATQLLECQLSSIQDV